MLIIRCMYHSKLLIHCKFLFYPGSLFLLRHRKQKHGLVLSDVIISDPSVRTADFILLTCLEILTDY